MNNIFQHYPKDRQKEIKNLINQFKKVEFNQKVIELGFCDIFICSVIKDISVNFTLVDTLFNEITCNDERQYVTLKPKYLTIQQRKLNTVQIVYNQKYNNIEHRHVLGTILNSDVNYENIGDIFIMNNNEIKLRCNDTGLKELNEFCSIINKCSIKYTLIDNDIDDVKDPVIKTFYCSSLRIDSLVKGYINKNRNFCQQLLKQKKVKLNQVIIDSNTKKCNKYDIISIRGYGRFEIIDITQSSNLKYRVNIKY